MFGGGGLVVCSGGGVYLDARGKKKEK